MAKTRDVNEDYQTYGINHNASRQEFQEQRVAEDFWRIVKHFVEFWETHDQLG
jgi:hypothetical protein